MTVAGAAALARLIAENRELRNELARERIALAVATGHPHARHPWVGRRSLTGQLITPDDVEAALVDDEADAARRGLLDDDERDTP